MTFEEHENAVHRARSALNDAICAAAADGISVKYDGWPTTVNKISTNLIGRVQLTRDLK